MYKVLIVDDHESMCDSLKFSLEESGNFVIAGSLQSAALAELFCERVKPDLVIMDVRTEGDISGIEATKNIRDKMPEIKVIVMSGFNEISYSPRAKEAGAHAFIFKSKSLDFFVEVAENVMKGQTYYAQPQAIPMPTGEVPLTEREMEILRLMCKYMTSKEIADELFITERTVKFHKANMLAKTGFKKSIELAFYMVSNGWINPLH
ncbi:MAG: response regulator transcription factor [Clostridiaceae bacterium]|nr:response regulator transcription factor [Clostridiaceae bacterium]